MNTQQLVLDVGTILEGQEAVDEGLIDQLGTIRDALDKLYDIIDSTKKLQKRKKTNKDK